MLDENLPVFFLKPSATGVKHHNELYLSHHGSAPEPAYHLQHTDPASTAPTHKNCYAVALFDAYNPDILFGEVLARPEWTKPQHADAQNGLPPSPQAVTPSEFTVQLYNPDQQVKVEVKSKWAGTDSYEFSMPQDVFRTPSASNLDKGQSDPASLEITPRLNFVWRKDGRLNKDLTCFFTGKSTDTKKKSNRKDPDISIALWRQMRELTVYEPNFMRVDLEDPKGLEVVLLLSAVVIKDLYFSSKDHMREVFHISDPVAPFPTAGAGGRKTSNPQAVLQSNPVPSPSNGTRPALPVRPLTSPVNSNIANNPSPNSAPPHPDARTKWESDMETARLQAEAQAERAAAHRHRREQEKRDEAERKRLQKMVEEEEKAARKKQADIEKETERLRKLYGVTPIPDFRPNAYQQPQVPPQPQGGGWFTQPGPGVFRPIIAPPGPSVGSNGMYIRPAASSSNVVMSGGNGAPPVPGRPAVIKKKSSFWR